MTVAGYQLSEEDHREQRLRALEAQLAAVHVVAAAGGVGLYTSQSGSPEYRVSPTAARLLGLPALETSLAKTDLQSVVFPEDWAYFESMFGVADTIIFRVQRPGKTLHWLEARGGASGVLVDITGRHEAEQSLIRSNADLQQFSYVASHDLQEPLRTVTTYAQLLQRRYQDKLDQDALEFLNFIVGASRRMDLLVRDLLAYSRSLQGDSRPMTDVNMNGIVAWTVLALQTELKETGGIVTHDTLPVVPGHELQLAQLVQQLVANALKFRRPDVSPEIHVSSVEQDGVWRFSVRDNGIGIDPQYFDRIFGAFKRLHGKEIPGTGIGLAICQNIVARHGGRLWVESTLGAGSTFHFTLSTPE